MKINSSLRYSTHAAIAAAMAVYILSPFATTAMAASDGSSGSSAECTRVQSFGHTALGNIQNRQTKLNTDAATDATKRLTDEQAFDAKIQADWTKWDAIRQDNFASLEKVAKTSSQKAAVSTFEQTVLGDVATRRDAVTAARSTFRSTVATAASNRVNQVDSAISTFQSSVTSAVNTAESNCTTDSASVLRSSFVVSLKDARTTFQTTLEGLPKLSTEVQTAANLRSNSVQAADKTFEQNVESAANTLKSALGQS